VEVDLREDEVEGVHRLVTSLVAPRPIGWISTVNGDGTPNLAPYSYFNLVHTDPPVVMFAAEDREGRVKHTPTNAIDTGEFVVNLVTEDLAERMDHSAVTFDESASEFETVGLAAEPAETLDAPRVAAAAAHLECTVLETKRVYSSTLVFGEVRYVDVAEELLRDGKIDAREIDGVGRLGGPYFTGIDVLSLTRTTEY